MNDHVFVDNLGPPILAALGDWPGLSRKDEGYGAVYTATSVDGRSVEVGYGWAHCWILLGGSWRAVSVGEVDSLLFDLELFLRAALLYLAGSISPPTEESATRGGSLARLVARRRRAVWDLDEPIVGGPIGFHFVG